MAGIWSFLGTFILFVLASLFLFEVNFGNLWSEFWTFISGGVNAVSTDYSSLVEVLGTIGAVVVIELGFCILVGVIVSSIKGKEESVFDWLNIEEGYHAATFFFIVLLEELFARWLFLGVLTKIFTGSIAFYVLLFIGNSIWALWHLSNYRKRDQSLMRVLPQFTSGLFFSFIYVKYGLLFTVITHYTSNAIVLASAKKQEVGGRDLALSLYYGIGFGIAYLILSVRNIGLDMLTPWFTNQPLVPLKGFGFWDYFTVLMVISFGLEFLVSILLFDHIVAESDEEPGFFASILLGPFVTIGTIYFVSWVLGLIISSVMIKALVVTILLLLLSRTTSLSAMSRNWFVKLIPMFLFVCIVTTLSFWTAIGLIALLIIISYIPAQIKRAEE